MKQAQCRCGEIARPKQRNCYRCHALANQVFRFRVKQKAERRQRDFLQAMKLLLGIDGVPETCDTNG
jgi:hypothetical protein